MNLGKRRLTYLTAFLGLIVCVNRGLAQEPMRPVRLLGSHDFSREGHTILFLPGDHYPDDAEKDAFPCYLESPKDLRALQDALVGTEPATVYPYLCLTSYKVMVCKEGRIIDRVDLSQNCHSMVGDSGEFAFGGYVPFDGYKRPRGEVLTFSSLATARDSLQRLRRDGRVIAVLQPEWEDYEGKFMFVHTGAPFRDREAYKQVSDDLAQRYPDLPWRLELHDEISNGATSTYLFYLHCTHALFARFSGYALNGQGWMAFEPIEAVVYRKAGK